MRPLSMMELTEFEVWLEYSDHYFLSLFRSIVIQSKILPKTHIKYRNTSKNDDLHACQVCM